MSAQHFLNKDNVNMLWDVISDEDILKKQSKESVVQVSQIFSNNINDFYNKERNKTNNLMDMNKKYIMLVLDYVKKTYPQSSSSLINSHYNLVAEQNTNVVSANLKKDFYLSQDIQNERIDQFDKNLKKKQEEFENMINVPVPPVPNFKDNLDDGPISEMDKILKQMTAQRNYDIEVINRNNVSDTSDDWLKPQETSLRNEKFQKISETNNDVTNKNNNVKLNINDKLNQYVSNQNQPQNQNSNQNSNQNIKYIKIDNEELDNSELQKHIIDLNANAKKQISWGENESISFYPEREVDEPLDNFTPIKQLDDNILLKLKKINPPITTHNQNVSNNLIKTVVTHLEEEINCINKKIETLDTKIENMDTNIKNILYLLKKLN